MDRFCNLSRRGSMSQLVEMVKSYWKDKKSNPLHRLHVLIDKEWKKTGNDNLAIERLMAVREGIFGALEMLSLSLPLERTTESIIQSLIKGSDWIDGRKRVRNECVGLVSDMIAKGKIVHLHPSGLRRDGFGFLVPDLSDAYLKEFKKAEPKPRRGSVSLIHLANSVVGRQLLREQMIVEDKLPEKDPRVSALQEAYDRLLVDLELDEQAVFPQETEQTLLNGPVAEDMMEYPPRQERDVASMGIQAELTEFITSTKEVKRTSKEKTRKKKSSKRKKGGKS